MVQPNLSAAQNHERYFAWYRLLRALYSMEIPVNGQPPFCDGDTPARGESLARYQACEAALCAQLRALTAEAAIPGFSSLPERFLDCVQLLHAQADDDGEIRFTAFQKAFRRIVTDCLATVTDTVFHPACTAEEFLLCLPLLDAFQSFFRALGVRTEPIPEDLKIDLDRCELTLVRPTRKPTLDRTLFALRWPSYRIADRLLLSGAGCAYLLREDGAQ